MSTIPFFCAPAAKPTRAEPLRALVVAMDKFQCVRHSSSRAAPLRTPSHSTPRGIARRACTRSQAPCCCCGRRFEQQISQSAHSVIHKGRRKHALEFVAIKSTAKSMRQQLMEEIRLLHAINHENVVRFHSWYETGNHLWVVSEFCAGGSLRQLLGQDGALPESTVLSLGLDVLAALERVHQEGYAMVQLEPEGILMTEYGIGKLSRFRKARPFGERPTEDEVTALRTSSARAARVHTPPARPQRHPLGPAHGLGASRRALSSLRGARALARRCQVRRVLRRVVVWQPAARARHRQACIRPPPCAFPAPHGAPRVSNGRAYAMPEDDLEGVPPP